MGKIRQLDESLSNMIAAGEVVENMASVIKELLENAIDANAKAITITLKESGLSMIRISDDGDGMDKEDLDMAFKRHATSKIKTHHDLHHIVSLGFRGEALPSIASVSNMTIESSADGKNGHKIVLKNGAIIERHKGQPKQGTTISVENLFYNTPARLKHLKSEQRELSFIVDYVNKIALSHPHIAFTLSNDNKTLLKTSGDGNVLKILHEIYPLDIIKNMVPFNHKNQYFKIEGYLAKPAYNRSSNQHMTVITNHRIIKNKKLLNAIKTGFDTYLPMHKYPIVYLEITVDPIFIDVNIHPQKLEVKFSEQHSLEALITATINDTLRGEDLIPTTKKTMRPSSQASQVSFEGVNDNQDKPTHQNDDAATLKEDRVPFQSEATQAPNIEASHPHPTKPQSTKSQDTFPANQFHQTPNQKSSPKKRLPDLEYIGQYLGTYLLFQNKEGLYIMDQHAAAERIRYERYKHAMSQTDGSTQELLSPIELHLSSGEVIAFDTYKEKLNAYGLDITQKDRSTLLIHRIPTWFRKNMEQVYAEIMVKTLLNEDQLSVGLLIDQLAKDLSCKHSIRANKYLNRNEVDVLLKDLHETDNPFTCPHGRPTIINLSVRELETMFKRVQ